MKMPNPWGDNKLDSKFKSFIEELRQFTISVFNKSDDDYKRLNKRVSNLVISSCQDNDNEVKDGRTDIEGTLHNSLQEHLVWISADSRQRDANQKESINETNDKLEKVSKTVNNLFDGSTDSKYIYVSKERGNDQSGDGTEENPFATIQKAVDAILIISVTSYFIIVDKGAYNEDIVILNKIATSIEIRAYNHAVTSALTNIDTGVFVRSIKIMDVSAYCAVRGLTQFNSKLGPNYFIYGERAKYVAMDNLKVTENTKSNSVYNALVLSSTNGHLYLSDISNQKNAILADYTSSIICGTQTIGSGNDTVITSNRSIVFKSSGFTATGTTQTKKLNGGQIFE